MNKNEIKNGLRDIGLKRGDIVILHSSLSSIGHVKGGADTVINAFLETIGEAGTLVVPVFDKLGIITETLKQRPNAIVSDCPLGTVAAIGADAEFICRDHWRAATVHGHGTPYLKIAELGGYVCLLGVDQDRNTTMHTVEALLELPYLNDISAKVDTSDGKHEATWKYYPGPHRDFIGLDRKLLDGGIMRVGKIGNAVTRLMKSRELIEFLTKIGTENPAFCLCDNPNCADCVKQRAALRRAELAREPFKFAVASSVAGHYVPEIIDNLKTAGVDYVELDMLRGHPAHTLDSAILKTAAAEFKANHINVSGLRLPAIPTDFPTIIALLKTINISRLLMPLSSDAAIFAKQAVAASIELVFYNLGVTGNYASRIMNQLAVGKESAAGFAFSPANFARIGEKPFLESFQQGKFRKYITQLDIEDALFDGSSALPGNGNAEIRELVSILRCASFSGYMTISGINRSFGSARELAEQFLSL